MALSWSLTLCLWLHNMGRVQLRNQHSSRKRAHHLVYFSPASFHTNTQTPVDSRQNGGRSPKQSDFLDDPFLSCKTPQRGAATVLGSDVGVPGGEARNQAFCGETGLWGQLECCGDTDPQIVTGPLCSVLICFWGASESKSSPRAPQTLSLSTPQQPRQ